MNGTTRAYCKTALAAAIAAALSAPVAAQSISNIEQRLSGAIDQNVLNRVTVDAAGRAALATINLGLDANGVANVGGIQLGSLQANTFGWSTLSGTRDSAVTVSGAALGLTQTINALVGIDPLPSFDLGTVTQSVSNSATVTATSAYGTLASASIRGLGQIGGNTYAAAGASFTAPTAEFVLTQDLGNGDADRTDLGKLTQSVTNTLTATVSGIGSAEINGLSGAGSAAASAIQYGVNSVTSAGVYGNGNDITMKSLQNISVYAPTDSINTSIVNTAAASAGNLTRPIPSPTAIGGLGGALLIDPAVRNLDQIAVYSANTITGNNPGGTTRLIGGDSLSSSFFDSAAALDTAALSFNATTGQFMTSGDPSVVGYPVETRVGGFTSVIEQLATGLTNQINSLNIASALNGNGLTGANRGYGDSALEKIGQTISNSLNSVSLTGTAASTTNGTTVAANPANAQVGSLLVAGVLPAGYTAPNGYTGTLSLPDGTFGVGLSSFDQKVDGLTIAGLGLNGSTFSGITAGTQTGAVVGNLGVAATGIGNSSIANLTQLVNLSANTFSVDGNLTGVTLPTQPDALVPTYTYFEQGTGTDLYSSSQTLANMANWSMTQSANNVNVTLPNYAFSVSSLGNAALSGLDQTLVARMNDISAGGNMSGNFLQTVVSGVLGEATTTPISLGNVGQAVTGTGNVTGTGTNTQLLYASLNNISAGGNFSGVLSQTAESLNFGGIAVDGVTTLATLPMINSLQLNVDVAGTVNVNNLSQTAVANLNNMSLGGTVSGNLSQYASDVTQGVENRIAASSTLGTVQLGSLSQTIVSSINTMALGNAVAANVSQLASGNVSQIGNNVATVGGIGSTLSTVAGVNQIVTNRVNAITLATAR